MTSKIIEKLAIMIVQAIIDFFRKKYNHDTRIDTANYFVSEIEKKKKTK